MDVAEGTRLAGESARARPKGRTLRQWAGRGRDALKGLSWPEQLWPLLKVLRLPIGFTAATFLIFSLGQSKSVLEAVSRDGRFGAYGSLVAATLIWAAAAWYSCRVLLYFHRKRLPFDPRKSAVAEWLPRVLGSLTFEAVGGWHWWSVSASIAFLSFTLARRKLLDARRRLEPLDDDGVIKGFARYFFAISLIVFLILSVLFAMPSGNALARWMGAGAIVCLGLACLTALIAGASIVKFPVVPFELALLAWLVFASWWNDNHTLRILRSPSGPAASAPAKPTLQEYFARWLDGNLAGARPVRGAVFPIFLATAEGGGIKAAYWTAGILSRLQDRFPAFGGHLFLVSGVSGGSLGAATFSSLFAERKDGESLRYEAQADAVLSRDHLSPILARFFFTDCLARFSPLAVPAFDRGRAMESSWEETWKSVRGDDLFAQCFHRLWADSARTQPALLLNGTHVESGRRVIASNLKVDRVFADALDLDEVAGPEYPVSAAASLSARFPFVTPSALIRGPHGKWGHVVDGGYYENSGAATAFEALQALRPVMAAYAEKEGIRIVPYTLLIRDDPFDSIQVNNFLNDLTDPFVAAYDTRAGRTTYSLAQLRAASDSVIEFNLSDPQVPLGWFLSGQGVDRIKRSLDGDSAKFADIGGIVAGTKGP